MAELGWRSVGVLELTALSSLPRERWTAWVEKADVLLVNGGDASYLCHWLRESGLADLFPSLDKVWVGLSAGSMALTPRFGEEFVEWTPPGESGGSSDRGLGFVPFSIFPHLDSPQCPWNTLANAEVWASKLDVPAYAMDDDTAIRVADGEVEVVSEGEWRRLGSHPRAPGG